MDLEEREQRAELIANRNRDYIGTAKTKQFLPLRTLIDNVELPPLEIES